MEIMPNSTIKFLRNIPFDNDYNDTIYFDNPNQQYNYFAGVNGFNTKFVKYTIDKNYYARHSANVIDVELPNPDTGVDPSTGVRYSASTTESLYDCNYMMFCNESFKRVTDEGYALSKWFYAFITDVEYVNNQVARVTFEIDAMQTWMFDYELEQCFIEREHSETDGIGDNIVDENLNIGDSYLTNSVTNKIATNETICAYILVSREEQNGSVVYERLVLRNNIPTTLAVYRFNCSSELTSMWNFIKKYIIEQNDLTPEEIVAIYLFPDETFWGVGENEITISLPSDFRYSLDSYHTSHHLTAYTPVNKKLFTSPYTILDVSNHEGTSQIYRFEYFALTAPTRQAKFKIFACDAPTPALVVYPTNYMPCESADATSSSKEGYDYGIAISDFQQCAWVGDAYKAWYAQNKNSFTAASNSAIIESFLHAVGGVARIASPTGSTAIGAGEALEGIGGMGLECWKAVAKREDISHQPPSINGLTNALSLPIAMDYFGYTFRTKQISGQYAEIVDEYFSMFGYATHRVKTPNRNVRERCTYTQTIGCTIKGKLPSSYQKQICRIYDKGIRFWNIVDWSGNKIELGKYKKANGELYSNKCVAERVTS